MEVLFEALKASDLSAMSLDALVELNTKLSEMRSAAGGELRAAIYAYALEVNKWITKRAEEREAAIFEAHRNDPERARLHQGIRMGGLASDGKLDELVARRKKR